MAIVKPVTASNSFSRGHEDVIIPAGQTVSNWCDLDGNTLGGLLLSSTLTASAIQFDVKMENGDDPFRLYDDTNTVVQLTLGAGRAYALDFAKFMAFRYVRIATVGGVGEAAARSIRLAARPF